MRKIILTSVAVVVVAVTTNFVALALAGAPPTHKCTGVVQGGADITATKDTTCKVARRVVYVAMYEWHAIVGNPTFTVHVANRDWKVKIQKKSLLRLHATAKAGSRQVGWDIGS
jgi:hypothetical protein